MASTPTDPHEIAAGSGTVDNGRGDWEWHAPGYQGEAHAAEHTDGYTGEVKAGAWIVKGNASWTGDVLGNPLTASADAGVGAHTGASGALTDHGMSANVDGFVGAEIGEKVQYDLGPVDLSLGAAGQAGARASGGLDFGMEDGRFVMGGTLGAAWGLGAKISPHIAVDPNALTDGLKKATDWVSDLFD